MFRSSSRPRAAVSRIAIRLILLPLLSGGWVPLVAADGAATLAGKVVRVIDGDTVDVQLTSGLIRVRLQGIDAPDKDQAGGAAASTWLASQLQSRQVELEPVSQDQYDRMVAVVRRRGVDINRELVRRGLAWAYRHYLRREDRALCSVEERARRSHVGLWANANPHAPWEYRSTAGKGPFSDYSRDTTESCLAAAGLEPTSPASGT